MAGSNTKPLFSGQTLAKHIEQKKNAIDSEVKQQTSRRRSEFAIIKDRAQILKEGAISIPEIISREAKVRADDQIEYMIQFKGSDGAFFRFQPTTQPDVDRPVGVVYASSLAFFVANSGDAAAIKAELAQVYKDFDSWYTALREEAMAFNQQLPKFVDETFAKHEEAEARAQELENELNN